MDVADWVALIGVPILLAVAVAAYLSLRAQAISQLTDAYASKEMLSGMQELRHWKEKYGRRFAKEFAKMRGNMDTYSEVQTLDEARRRFAHHFRKVALLYKSHVILKSTVQMVVTENQVQFLLEVIEPLEKAINQKYDTSTFDAFHRVYPNCKRPALSARSGFAIGGTEGSWQSIKSFLRKEWWLVAFVVVIIITVVLGIAIALVHPLDAEYTAATRWSYICQAFAGSLALLAGLLSTQRVGVRLALMAAVELFSCGVVLQILSIIF